MGGGNTWDMGTVLAGMQERARATCDAGNLREAKRGTKEMMTGLNTRKTRGQVHVRSLIEHDMWRVHSFLFSLELRRKENSTCSSLR